MMIITSVRDRPGYRYTKGKNKEGNFRKDTEMSVKVKKCRQWRREGEVVNSELLRQYGCGPVQFAGTDTALYEDTSSLITSLT